MSANTLAPWILTAASLAVAAFSFTRPVPTAEVVPTPAQAAAAHPVLVASAAPSRPGMDAETMREIVREVMREELPETAAAPEHAVVPAEAQLEMIDDGLVLVDDLIDLGHVTQGDIMDMRDAISQMDRAEGEVVLSAYFDALNSGEIVVDGAPL